jgi:hypothetical protein
MASCTAIRGRAARRRAVRRSGRRPRAVVGILKGEPVIGPKGMSPPPAVIMQANLDMYVDDKMPALH